MSATSTIKHWVVVGFAVCVFAAGCSSDGGRGDEPAVSDTSIADTTTTTTTTESLAEPSTTPEAEPTTTTTQSVAEPSTTAAVDTTTTNEPVIVIDAEAAPPTTAPTTTAPTTTAPTTTEPRTTEPPTTAPPTTAPTTTEPPTTAPPTTEPPTTEPPTTEPPTTEPATTEPSTTEPVDTTTTVTPTTTIWREATERIPAEATTTWLQEDPMLPADRERITYGASGPFRLESGMRLVTDATSYTNTAPYPKFPLDGAWIIGIVFFNNSTDSIVMYVCIEGVNFEGSPNVVGAWKLARTDIENEYLVIHVDNWPDGRRTAVVEAKTPEAWEERLSYYPDSPLHDFDVSECW